MVPTKSETDWIIASLALTGTMIIAECVAIWYIRDVQKGFQWS